MSPYVYIIQYMNKGIRKEEVFGTRRCADAWIEYSERKGYRVIFYSRKNTKTREEVVYIPPSRSD